MNFELTEALAYWESVKGSRGMHGEQSAEQPATGVDEWPDSLPCLMVADLQWRTDGNNSSNRTTFSILATKLSGGEQRTDWTVPAGYRYPGNMVSLQSVTADIASQIISGMKLQPDRLIQSWFDARCTAPAQTPAPVVTAAVEIDADAPVPMADAPAKTPAPLPEALPRHALYKKPEQRRADILAAISKMGFNPMALPPPMPGKQGVKNQIFVSLYKPCGFENDWQKLVSEVKIRYANEVS